MRQLPAGRQFRWKKHVHIIAWSESESEYTEEQNRQRPKSGGSGAGCEYLGAILARSRSFSSPALARGRLRLGGMRFGFGLLLRADIAQEHIKAVAKVAARARQEKAMEGQPIINRPEGVIRASVSRPRGRHFFEGT